LLLLIYFKNYPSKIFLSFTFSLSISTLNYWTDIAFNLMKTWSINQLTFPDYQTRMNNSVSVDSYNFSMIVDVKEQEIVKSLDPKFENLSYSGKKEANTISILVGISPFGHLYFISNSFYGSKNDQQVLDITILIIIFILMNIY